MIQELFEELKNGNQKIVDMFVNVEALWNEALSNIENLSEAEIADILSNKQWDVEQIFNSRSLGKSIMPWSAFSHLFSEGSSDDDRGSSAQKLANAFQQSTCSIEVKAAAKEAAKVYRVENFS